MQKDKQFAQKMTSATPEIKDFLNNVFKNEENSRDINYEIG